MPGRGANRSAAGGSAPRCAFRWCLERRSRRNEEITPESNPERDAEPVDLKPYGTADKAWLGRLLGALLLAWNIAWIPRVCGQALSSREARELIPPAAGAAKTVFDHSEPSRFWLSGQANFIYQWHPGFAAKYSGPNSLSSHAEHAVSRLFTLFGGFQVTETTEILVDAESTGGNGISDALGLAGYTNLDVVRNPDLGADPYLARLLVRQIIPLSDDKVVRERGSLSVFSTAPARRLEIRAGKLSTVDFFDVNSVGSDSHLQFLNWAVDNNAAYDYAADTRGYTYGATVEYDDRAWAARFGEMLMPKVANGLSLQWNLRRAHAENFELELRPELISGRSGVIRLLSFLNHANMGNYRRAIEVFQAGRDPVPDITDHPTHVRTKYGFGVNVEQEITAELRGFGRAGWNEGQHESFAYTEADLSGSLGADLQGNLWKRGEDKLGLVLVIHGISSSHRQYLRLGGHGFLLGDGNLTYGPERILETYYTLPLPIWPGIFASVDFQYIANPGYNRDRGPVAVPGARVHIDF